MVETVSILAEWVVGVYSLDHPYSMARKRGPRKPPLQSVILEQPAVVLERVVVAQLFELVGHVVVG